MYSSRLIYCKLLSICLKVHIICSCIYNRETIALYPCAHCCIYIIIEVIRIRILGCCYKLCICRNWLSEIYRRNSICCSKGSSCRHLCRCCLRNLCCLWYRCSCCFNCRGFCCCWLCCRSYCNLRLCLILCRCLCGCCRIFALIFSFRRSLFLRCFLHLFLRCFLRLCCRGFRYCGNRSFAAGVDNTGRCLLEDHQDCQYCCQIASDFRRFAFHNVILPLK